jgi:hypothetical protein
MQVQASGSMKDGINTRCESRGEYLHDHWAVRWSGAQKFGSPIESLKAVVAFNNTTFGANLEAGHRAEGELQKDGAPWMHPAKAAHKQYVSLWGHYNLNSSLTLAAKVEGPIKHIKRADFTGGLQYKLDKDTTMMTKLDSGLENTWYFSHKLNANSTVMVTSSVNLEDFASNSPQRDGYMGYPFVYGMKLKYEA